MKRRLGLGLLATPILVLLGLAAAEKPGTGQEGAFAPMPWNCLEYHAEHLIFKAITKLCVKKASTEDMAVWNHAGDTRIPALVTPKAGARLFEFDVQADIVGRKSQERIFFEPDSGRVLQRTKIKLGSDPYRKTYRFGTAALEWTRSAPETNAETAQGETAWTKIEHFSAAYPGDPGCSVYSEPVLLLYLVATHDWEARKNLDLCILANQNWSRVEAISTGLAPFAASYQKNGQTHQVNEARVVLLKARAVGEDHQDPFELMGLRGDIRLYLEPKSGLPLAIRGEMPWLGEVTVHLLEAELGSS